MYTSIHVTVRLSPCTDTHLGSTAEDGEFAPYKGAGGVGGGGEQGHVYRSID